MKSLRFVIASLAAAGMLAMSTLGASAQGVGGSGGGTGGGSTGGSGGIGNAPGGGSTLGWGACPAGLTMVMWNAGPGGAHPLGSSSPPGSALAPWIWNPVANPTGNVYVWPNTPWGGAPPPNNLDQNGQSYYPWWGCYPVGTVTFATPPRFAGFNAFAPSTIQRGQITLLAPSQCAANLAACRLLVFSQVEARANTVPCVAAGTGLTPMVAPPALPYPSTNTGVAFYPAPATPGCPESVTVVGTDTTGTWSYKYTLQWRQVTVPGTTCAGDYFDWGVPADGTANHSCVPTNGIASHVYQHVAPNGPYTPGSGAHITARAEWEPECSGVVTNLFTGATALNDPVPGSYACVNPGPMPQTDNGPTLPIFQIESIAK